MSDDSVSKTDTMNKQNDEMGFIEKAAEKVAAAESKDDGVTGNDMEEELDYEPATLADSLEEDKVGPLKYLFDPLRPHNGPFS